MFDGEKRRKKEKVRMIKTRGRVQSTQPAGSRRKKKVLFMGKKIFEVEHKQLCH